MYLDLIEDYIKTDLLSMIVELYLQIYGDFKYQEHIQSICQKWIDGQTPMEINNEETIGIAEVEALCNKRISYEMNFIFAFNNAFLYSDKISFFTVVEILHSSVFLIFSNTVIPTHVPIKFAPAVTPSNIQILSIFVNCLMINV